MGFFDNFIPKEVREALNEVKGTLEKIFADQKTKDDMDIVLSATIPLFEAASKNPATDKSLKSIFNDVAVVLPFFKDVLKQRELQMTKVMLKAAPLISVFNRLGEPSLKQAFEDQGPEVAHINSELLKNESFQDALERILTRPIGRDLFDLVEKDGKGSAQEKLTGSGLAFPLAQDNYNRVKAKWNPNGGKPPQGPSGPGV